MPISISSSLTSTIGFWNSVIRANLKAEAETIPLAFQADTKQSINSQKD